MSKVRNGVTYVRKHSATANVDIKRAKIAMDTTRVVNWHDRDAENLLARIARRKELAEMRRSGKNGSY